MSIVTSVMIGLLFCSGFPLYQGVGKPAVSGYLEVRTDKASYYRHEVIRVRIRFGLDEEGLRKQVIQPFRQELDLPIRIEAAWTKKLSGARLLAAENSASPAGLRSFILGDELAWARKLEEVRSKDGRRIPLYEWSQDLVVAKPGTLEIRDSRLHFAYTRGFKEDFLKGRIPLDRNDVVLPAKDLEIVVHELPLQGRPSGFGNFGNAVGRFQFEARVVPGKLRVGQSLELELRFEGEGNLADFVPPGLLNIEGFHLLGRSDSYRPGLRLLKYEFRILPEARAEFPAIPWVYFDPASGRGYQVLHSSKKSLAIEGLLEAKQASPAELDKELDKELEKRIEPRTDIADLMTVGPARYALQSSPSQRFPSRGSPLPLSVLLLSCLAPWLFFFATWSWRRGHEQRLQRACLARARRAAERLRVRCKQAKGELSKPFIDYLAIRLACLPAAVIGPALPDRLKQWGLPAALAQDCFARLDHLVAQRYGARSRQHEGEETLQLLEQLEQEFDAIDAGVAKPKEACE